jgi:hypothetical protein
MRHYYGINYAGSRTVNAITRPEFETDDRVARQMRMCRDLAELGMALAQAAAKKALADFAALAEPPAASAAPAETAPDYTQLFIRLSANVRQIMLLEARLDAGEAPPRPRAARAPADPRRDIIRQALDFAIGNRPDRATVSRAAWDLLDRKLAADPNCETRPAAIIHSILDPMGINVSIAKMPSALRDALTGKRP